MLKDEELDATARFLAAFDSFALFALQFIGAHPDTSLKELQTAEPQFFPSDVNGLVEQDIVLRSATTQTYRLNPKMPPVARGIITALWPQYAAQLEAHLTLFTHAAIIVDTPDHTYSEVILAPSEEAALNALRNRAHSWEGRSVLQDLDLSQATLEQLNELYTDGDTSSDSLVTIGVVEPPFIPPSRLTSQEWHWRDEGDGCLVAGAEEAYVLLPSPLVPVSPEHKALIAAAPALLAVCEALLMQSDGADTNQEFDAEFQELEPELRAAVAKARLGLVDEQDDEERNDGLA